MKINRNFIASLSLCAVIAIVAALSAKYIPYLGGVTLAIIIGIILRNSVKIPDKYGSGFNYAEKSILPLAIALLGVQLDLNLLIGLGFQTFLGICLIMASTLFVSFLLGRVFKFGRDFSLLLGCGNAVCGSSAIGAAASVLHVDEDEVGLSIGVVNLLGTIGLFVIPALVFAIGANNVQGGFLAGGSLQSVGQAVAAGFSINDDTGQLATLVKMGRVLMLGPVILSLLLIKRFEKSDTARSRKGFKVPLFIVGFGLLAGFSALGLIHPVTKALILFVAKFLLITAMAAIGLKIHLKTLFSRGPRVFCFGLTIAVIQTAVDLAYAVCLLK
jgi:uncharacterized integral membrane protein (TIGR00698 family)